MSEIRRWWLTWDGLKVLRRLQEITLQRGKLVALAIFVVTLHELGTRTRYRYPPDVKGFVLEFIRIVDEKRCRIIPRVLSGRYKRAFMEKFNCF